MRLWCVLGSIAIALSACGDDVSSPADASATEDQTDAAPRSDAAPDIAERIHDDCAPNDGAALTIVLALAEPQNAGACRADEETGPTLSFTVYRGASDITPPQTIAFAAGQPDGHATLCPGGAGPCELATSGEITFTALQDEVSAAGSFELTFAGETESDTFDVRWCTPPQPTPCG